MLHAPWNRGSWPRRMVLFATLAAPMLAEVAAWRAPAIRARPDEVTPAQALFPDSVGPLLDRYPAGALHIVGTKRLALGVVDSETGPIEDATIDLLYFKIAGNEGNLTEAGVALMYLTALLVAA